MLLKWNFDCRRWIPHLFIEESDHSSFAWSLRQRHSTPILCFCLDHTGAASQPSWFPQEPSRGHIKHKARWGQGKTEVKPEGRWPVADQIISDKHQVPTCTQCDSKATLHSESEYIPVAMYEPTSNSMSILEGPVLGQAYGELKLKQSNGGKRRPIRTEEEPWKPLLQQNTCEHMNNVELQWGLWNSSVLPMCFKEWICTW